jgi:hypothetical protein
MSLTDYALMTQVGNGHSTTKVNFIFTNKNILNCHFPKNSQLKPKKKKLQRIMIDLKVAETLVKRIRTNDPLHKTNKIMCVLFVARVGILIEFANSESISLYHRLT